MSSNITIVSMGDPTGVGWEILKKLILSPLEEKKNISPKQKSINLAA